MTTTTDVTNDALQLLGTRTTVASLSESSNEAIQANLIITKLRDQLLRMAPWDCAFNFASLSLITAVPGTPENTSVSPALWAKGLPPPPWAYEYQYPVDCLRAQVIVPQNATGFASGIPLTSAVTGGATNWWSGPPAKFKVSVDQFHSVLTFAIASPGSGYARGDVITFQGTTAGSAPIGCPAQVVVDTVNGSGAILTASLVSVMPDVVQSGSYFNVVPATSGTATTTGSGTGASFTVTGSTFGDQRVILCNQEFPILGYCRQIVDPGVMDPLFLNAWTHILAARLSMALTGDKAQANMQIQLANAMIIEARKADGNEGLTINDVTPDWVRFRGIAFNNWDWSPNQGWDWGGLWPTYS